MKKEKKMTHLFQHKLKASALFFTAGLLGLINTTSYAQVAEETSFSHNDWELVCDNTGTCRAAGYSSDDGIFEDDAQSVSVLLTRKAGANQPITGQVLLAQWDETPVPKTLELKIGNKSYGKIDYSDESNPAQLSAQQVQALLASAKTNETITFVGDKKNGQLSNQGMSAVLLKMDDLQKRVGTTGAVIKKGNLPETNVLQPKPTPQITIPKTLEKDKELAKYYLNQEAKLIGLIQLTYSEECHISAGQDTPLTIYPLNENYALLMRACWMAAYNYGEAAWLINKELTSAELISNSITDYENGELFESHKGRGIGDCWYTGAYSWNGKTFVQTSALSTGMCKGQPGGFWSLPTLKYDVVNLNN